MEEELVTRRVVMRRGAAIQMKRTVIVVRDEAISSGVSK